MIGLLLSVLLVLVGLLHMAIRKNLLAATQSVSVIFMGLVLGFASSGAGSRASNEATALFLLIGGSFISSLIFALERRTRMKSFGKERRE